MNFSPFGLRQMANAAENTTLALSYAETALNYLARLHADHDLDRHERLGLEAVCHLCGQGLSYVLKAENDNVENLVSRLRELATAMEIAK